jgi:hypothetical protein
MVLRQEGFTIVIETMVVAAVVEDMMMMMMPLMIPFIQGLLFDMHLLISQETQVVCC